MVWILLLLMGCSDAYEREAQAKKIAELEAQVATLEAQAQRARIRERTERAGRREAEKQAQALETTFELLPTEERAEAEALRMVNSLRRAEKAYHAEWDSFTSAPRFPSFIPGRIPQEFSLRTAPEPWRHLDWTPEAEVLCQYEAEAEMAPETARRRKSRTRSSDVLLSDAFVARARCDADGDGIPAVYEATRQLRGHKVSAEHTR